MTAVRCASIALLIGGIVTGTVVDRPMRRAPLVVGGYRVLAADFHTHSSLWSDGMLTPWGLVFEAERQGLDVIAITGHNEVWDGQLGQRVARLVGGPIVLPGEEITSEPNYHLIAAGITHRVRFSQPASAAIAAIHAQGGLAIAAHPSKPYWHGYDLAARAALDGSEVCHPLIFRSNRLADFEAFFHDTHAAPIGSSDFHGLGTMGICRTYVFATGDDEQAVIDAVRARRTIAYGPSGPVEGDPALIHLAEAAGIGRRAPSATSHGRWSDWVSRAAGLVGLLGLIVFGRGPVRRRSDARAVAASARPPTGDP